MSSNGVSIRIATITIFVAIGIIFRLASGTRAKQREEGASFGPPLSIVILAIALSVGFVVLFLFLLFTQPFEYGLFLLLAIASLGLVGIPPNITVTPEKLTEKYWWRSEKTIFWKDVQTINPNTASGGFQIKGLDGQRITHSKMNRDRFEFERLCKKYAPINRR
jgi:hypothetical protein